MSKICPEHWNQLREAIETRGMSHLIAKDGKVATDNVVASLQGIDTKENFDPLMSANFAILGNSVQCFGIDILGESAPCPLCLLDKHVKECVDPECQMKQSGTDWIGFAADGSLETARELGLIGAPN
jgi:hypothetical protein